MGVIIERPQPLWWLRSVEINYDLTPQEALELLPDSDFSIKSQPEEQMRWWSDGKNGVVQADIPLLRIQQPCTTTQARQWQEDFDIGFSLPVEIASLALPQNEPAKILFELNKRDKMLALIALGRSTEELLQLEGSSWGFCLFIDLCFHAFGIYFDGHCREGSVLPGAPRVL